MIACSIHSPVYRTLPLSVSRKRNRLQHCRNSPLHALGWPLLNSPAQPRWGLQEWENWRQRTTSCKLRAGKGNHNGAGEHSQICWRRSQAHSLLLSPAAYCQSPWPARPLSLGGRP